MTLRRAVTWSLIWVLSAVLFAFGLAAVRDPGAASLFLSAYVLEKALSIDNLMVFSAIFAYFGIKTGEQPGILYWGFVGAVVLRFLFLFGGASLMNLHPIVGLLFGAIVIWSGYKMLTMGEDEGETDYNSKWFVQVAKCFSTTPAFVCLVAIEISDIIFAFDSMPAVIAVASDPVIVYSAVMFAVLGLRSMYFVLEALMRSLSRLGTGVIIVLFYVGAKLVGKSLADMTGIENFNALDVGPIFNLVIVLGTLAIAVIASILWPEAQKAEA